MEACIGREEYEELAGRLPGMAKREQGIVTMWS